MFKKILNLMSFFTLPHTILFLETVRQEGIYAGSCVLKSRGSLRVSSDSSGIRSTLFSCLSVDKVGKMDPAKRMCLKNLPPDVTKKDIADLIKKRSRSQPQYIDLGLKEDGTPRRYAHVTVEGLKSVIENINGALLNGYNVIAEQAQPHFAFKLLEAKRARERAEREAEEERQRAVDAMNARLQEQGNTITVENAPKSFYHNKQRYARIGAEIAKRLREERNPPSLLQPLKHVKKQVEGGRAAKKARVEKQVVSAKKEEDPVVAPEPPPPTKDQRKLAGLQAKLQALKEKMKK
jgi:hypothetical protein